MTASPSKAVRLRSDSAQGVHDRGQYLTLRQAVEAYPAFSLRLVRRLVQERRIAFSRAGRLIVVAEADIESYLEHNRVEAMRERHP
jgi:CRP-like cAMP-binding protein